MGLVKKTVKTNQKKMNTRFFKKRPHLIPVIVTAILLLVALGDWPYVYYQLLRFAVCGVSVYLAWAWGKSWSVLLFGGVAVLFNPILPIHLPREIWQIIDLALSVLFFIVEAGFEVIFIIIIYKPLILL